jgi:hypothetical protein
MGSTVLAYSEYTDFLDLVSLITNHFSGILNILYQLPGRWSPNNFRKFEKFTLYLFYYESKPWCLSFHHGLNLSVSTSLIFFILL